MQVYLAVLYLTGSTLREVDEESPGKREEERISKTEIVSFRLKRKCEQCLLPYSLLPSLRVLELSAS